MWLYIALLGLLAVAGAWWGWRLAGNEARLDATVLVTLVVVGTLGVILRERDLGPHLGVSLATVVLAAALPLAGSVGAVVVGFVSYACDVRQHKMRPRVFNAAMTALVGAVGALVYVWLGGLRVDATDYAPHVLLYRVGLPLFWAYLAMTAVNALLYGVMSSLVRGTRVLDTAWMALRQLGVGYLGHVVIAFLFAVLWGPAGLGPLSAALVLGPLVAAHWSIGREALSRREHEETVATFVAALEEADPVSVGHSARVAELADLLAPQVGIGGRAVQDLRYAALLHDIGLVTTRSQLSSEGASDEVTYLSAVSGHPESGVAVLEELHFLTGALPAIAHHHERWDGRGYPAGLAGEDIPLAARVIAVADAFDALTTGRGSEPVAPAVALEALRERAGSHLDPSVVEALEVVLARIAPRGPRPARPVPDVVAASGHGPSRSWPDHDHPSLSDAFAEWQPETVARASWS